MAVKRRTASKGKRPKREGLGGGSVDRKQAQQKERRKRNKAGWVSIGDGNEVVVRAIDTKELFKDGFVHPVEFERRDGSTYNMDVLCLDQDEEGDPCPGCRDDLDRRYKFWMVVIERDADKTNAAGKVTGTADELKILGGANRLVTALNAKHKRRDLAKRDILIAQTGTSFDVNYEVDWEDEEDTSLSKADQKLIDDDEKVIDTFERFTTPPADEESFYEPPGGNFEDDDDEDPGEKSKRRGSVFDKKRKKGIASKVRARDDDEKDDEDEPPRRRSVSKSEGLTAKGKKTTTSRPQIKRRAS